LGVAFAKELAGRGFDVVLISRSYDNLINLVSDIQSQYSVQAYGIHADFFLGQTVFNEIEEALLTDKLDIGILVNVNPIKYDHPQYFTQIPTLRLWQIINVNIASTTMVSYNVIYHYMLLD
jgi:short-subunit dehydrogenase